MQSAQNNDQFKLENLFNVKDKVVVVTGMSIHDAPILHILTYTSQVVDPALA